MLILRRTSCKSLGLVAIDEAIVGRFYQTCAIRRIGEAFEPDHLRKALLVYRYCGRQRQADRHRERRPRR